MRSFPGPQCNDTDVQLVDGLTVHDCRVEICLNGLWGSVCGNSWDTRDASVVCRQLGYNGCKFLLASTLFSVIMAFIFYISVRFNAKQLCSLKCSISTSELCSL